MTESESATVANASGVMLPIDKAGHTLEAGGVSVDDVVLDKVTRDHIDAGRLVIVDPAAAAARREQLAAEAPEADEYVDADGKHHPADEELAPTDELDAQDSDTPTPRARKTRGSTTQE